MTETKKELSQNIAVVVPVKNELENIAPLLEEIAAAAEKAPIKEVVYVDDGSTDATLKTLKDLKATYPYLKIISHDVSGGQSAALWTGIKAATQGIIVTLDGDGQNDPADIPLLYQCYVDNAAKSETPVMVAGQREKRHDNIVRKISSRVANNVRSALLQDGTRDTGCSLKLYRREDYLSLPYFNHMHRFLPALMNREGVKVLHVDVSHRPRTRGVSKYGMWDRLWVGIADLFGVMWLQRRACRKMTVHEE